MAGTKKKSSGEKSKEKQESKLKPPWPRGVSGNPAGKPKGCLHKATRVAQELLNGEAEKITRKAIERALAGDSIALRLCLERLVPVRKERSVALSLPKIAGVSDLPAALARVLETVASGEITPGEGQTMAVMLDAYRKGLESADIESRLRALEERAHGKL